MSQIILGKVAFVDKGVYATASTYNTFDFVVTDDSCYLCVKDGNKNHPLTDTAWWKCIAVVRRQRKRPRPPLRRRIRLSRPRGTLSLLRVWLTLKRWRLGNRLIWPVEHLMRLWLPLSRLRR